MTRSVRELLRVSAEKQRLDQEMKIAAQVQARLFPRSLPQTAALDMAPGICIPARAVSGDYYDFLDVAPQAIGIVVADVCGKGMSAALLMSNLQANLRGQVQAYRDAYQSRLNTAAIAAEASESGNTALATYADLPLQAHPVKGLVERVNRQIEASILDASYITLFYAEFDEQTSTLRYTNAGHNPPLLVRRGSNGGAGVERLDCGGTVLGLFAEAQYEEAALKLGSGDLLAAFTDGLIEARNPQGDEFGEERLTSLLANYASLPAAEIERLILQSVKNWTGGAEQEDDLTLIIFKVK
jgi:sigma-B regulation protein RsbU (phosphoserine phosphatase)